MDIFGTALPPTGSGTPANKRMVLFLGATPCQPACLASGWCRFEGPHSPPRDTSGQRGGHLWGVGGWGRGWFLSWGAGGVPGALLCQGKAQPLGAGGGQLSLAVGTAETGIKTFPTLFFPSPGLH